MRNDLHLGDRIRIWDKKLYKFVTDDYLLDTAFNFYTREGKDVDIAKQFDLEINHFIWHKDIYDNPIYQGDIVINRGGFCLMGVPSVVVAAKYEDIGWFQGLPYKKGISYIGVERFLQKINGIEIYEEYQMSFFQPYEKIGNIYEHPELLK